MYVYVYTELYTDKTGRLNCFRNYWKSKFDRGYRGNNGWNMKCITVNRFWWSSITAQILYHCRTGNNCPLLRHPLVLSFQIAYPIVSKWYPEIISSIPGLYRETRTRLSKRTGWSSSKGGNFSGKLSVASARVLTEFTSHECICSSSNPYDDGLRVT